MRNLLKPAIGGAIFMLAALLPRAIHADEFDKKTVMTFSGPVQVPGMTLDAGKYVFKLLDSTADRFVVQIFNERENHLYTTLLAIPNLHLTTPEKTIVSFYEAPVGQAEPIKAWFYPGDNYGRQFVYPKGEAELIAKATGETVPSDATYGTVNGKATTTEAAAPPTTDTSNAQINQPVTTDSTVTSEPTNDQPSVSNDENAAAVTPATPEPTNDVTEPATPAEPAVSPEPDQTPAPDTTSPAPADNSALPATASNWPLVALLGLFSIGGAIALRFASRLS